MGRCPTLKKEGYVSGVPVRTPLLFSRTPLAFFAGREFIFFLGGNDLPPQNSAGFRA